MTVLDYLMLSFDYAGKALTSSNEAA